LILFLNLFFKFKKFGFFWFLKKKNLIFNFLIPNSKFQIKVLKNNLINFLIFNFGHFYLKFKKKTKKIKFKFKLLIPDINCKVSIFNLRYIWFRPNHWLSQKPLENLFKYWWVPQYKLWVGMRQHWTSVKENQEIK
jgi:hypothetical protein